MIKTGCANAHPEDLSFLLSGEATRLFRSKNMVIDSVSVPLKESSVDVLFVDITDVNKLLPLTDLHSLIWVLMSSDMRDAWQAWQLGAVGFLLRPFTLSQLASTLERVEQIYSGRQQLSALQLQPRTVELQMTKGRRLSVQSQDILFLEARGEITCVHLCLPGQEKLIATKNLGFWEDRLDDAEFVRTHKKYLVNIAHVTALDADAIRVQDHILPIAKRRRKEVEKNVLSRRMGHSFPQISM